MRGNNPTILGVKETPKKESYGDSGRLSPDGARSLITDLVRYMENRAFHLANSEANHQLNDNRGSTPSAQKQYYGDSWRLLYGIHTGMSMMKGEKRVEFSYETEEEIDYGISGDDSWQEHYDEYGYGPYGRGLKIGKRLAFYEDRGFEFSSYEDEDEEDSTFTIREYDDES